MSYTPIKPTINILPPYKKGTNLIIATNENIKIDNPQGLVVYGYIPKSIFYKSISTNTESKIIRSEEVCVIITKTVEVYNFLEKLMQKEYPNVDYIWLCPKDISNIIIIKCVMDENSEAPTLYMRLYTTTIKSIPKNISNTNITSKYNENKDLERSVYIKSIMNTISQKFNIIKNISVSVLSMYGNDSLNYITETITLKENELVGISCIDHAKTKCAHTSTINIIDNDDDIIITQLSGTTLSNKAHEKGTTTNFMTCDHKKPFKIIESIYYNPETKLAPLQSQIHSMLVFLLKNK